MSTPITKEGHVRLSKELQDLKTTERPMIIQAIAEARAHGDLKENAEYHSAKEKQGFIEARIRLLESLLSSADIIDPQQVGGDGRCIFGAYARLRDEDDRELYYRLVGEFESNIEKGEISATSPLGRALIGKRAGDVVELQVPAGTREYEILSVDYTKAEG